MQGQQPLNVTAAFAELGRIKLGETDLDGILAHVAHLARQTLPGAGEVSITLVRGSRAETAAWTGPLALQLDEWQYETGDGPCLEAAATRATVAAHDLLTDPRWPQWSGRAAAAGAGSSLSVGLPIEETLIGALNIYGTARNSFDQEAINLAQTFAGYAAVALANAHLYETTANLAQHMQTAMETRAVIEQAKGIIMGERRCTADEAFAVLTRASQHTNRKLRDIAAALVARTERPPRP